jgi:hypothetical protein
MEMRATVHCIAQENPKAAEDAEVASALVHERSDRQRKLFKPEHIRKAWQRLHEQGWLTATSHME